MIDMAAGATGDLIWEECSTNRGEPTLRSGDTSGRQPPLRKNSHARPAGPHLPHDRERKVLFTGDHILPVITPHVSYMPDSDTDPLGDYIAGLETLRVLDVEHTLPAHEFTISNLEERVQELERHHEERNQFVLDALADGPKTAY
jgi:hypothetical protein